MTFTGLRIAGRKPGPYVLGDPLDVFDGAMHLGRLNSVSTSANGSELKLEDFRTTDLSRLRTWRTARLIVVEVIHFFVEQYPSVSAIGIVLSADIESLEGQEGGATRLASARAQMLQSVGADDIHVMPMPHPRHAAHFTVSGVWKYNRDNAQMLADALRIERAAYAERLAAAAAASAPASAANPPRSVFSRLLAKDR